MSAQTSPELSNGASLQSPPPDHGAEHAKALKELLRRYEELIGHLIPENRLFLVSEEDENKIRLFLVEVSREEEIFSMEEILDVSRETLWDKVENSPVFLEDTRRFLGGELARRIVVCDKGQLRPTLFGGAILQEKHSSRAGP